MSQLSKLSMIQANKCFLCNKVVPKEQQSVEHILAKAHGGKSEDGNCIMVCKRVNQMLGNMTLKDKVRVFLAHEGRFKCPK